MFDILTAAQLYTLHTSLCDQVTRVQDRMLAEATWTPHYQLLKAHAAELHETASAVYRAAVSRDQEAMPRT